MNNIGNSVLASSSPRILQPMEFKRGILKIIPDREADTHRLEFSMGNLKGILASHPNGYSCHSLAERIISNDSESALKQAHYIVACGGTANFDAIKSVL